MSKKKNNTIAQKHVYVVYITGTKDTGAGVYETAQFKVILVEGIAALSGLISVDENQQQDLNISLCDDDATQALSKVIKENLSESITELKFQWEGAHVDTLEHKPVTDELALEYMRNIQKLVQDKIEIESLSKQLKLKISTYKSYAGTLISAKF